MLPEQVPLWVPVVSTQLMAAGLEVTVPVPLPASVTVSATVVSAKVAVTFCAEVMVTVQGLVPGQPVTPDQPENAVPVAGAAGRAAAGVSVALAGQRAAGLPPVRR